MPGQFFTNVEAIQMQIGQFLGPWKGWWVKGMMSERNVCEDVEGFEDIWNCSGSHMRQLACLNCPTSAKIISSIRLSAALHKHIFQKEKVLW